MPKINNTTMILGDCFEHLKKTPDETIDCIITDPPYGINFQSNHRKEKFDVLQNDENINWLPDTLTECMRVLKHALNRLR